VRLKQFLSLWYVWHKPFTYLAPTLTLSPNAPKRNSTWPTSPRSSIGCVQNNFWAYGMFGANHAPILRQDLHYLQTEWIKILLEPHHFGEPSGASKTIYDPMIHLAQTVHLSCTDTYSVSKWTKQVSTWPKSPRSSILFDQNDFRAYGMLGANNAPILHRH
jgi:hypothetical protein